MLVKICEHQLALAMHSWVRNGVKVRFNLMKELWMKVSAVRIIFQKSRVDSVLVLRK